MPLADNNNRKNCLHLPLYVFAFAISGAVHFYWMNERECELKDLDADRSLMNTRAIELLSVHFGVAAGLFHCVEHSFIRAFVLRSNCGLKVKYMLNHSISINIRWFSCCVFVSSVFHSLDMTMMIAIMELNGARKKNGNNNNKNNSNHF